MENLEIVKVFGGEPASSICVDGGAYYLDLYLPEELHHSTYMEGDNGQEYEIRRIK